MMTLIDAAVVVVAGEDSEDDDIDSFMMTLLTAWDGVLQVGLGSLRALSRASFGCNGSVSQPSQRLYDDGSAAGRSTPAGFRSIPEVVCVCVCACNDSHSQRPGLLGNSHEVSLRAFPRVARKVI